MLDIIKHGETEEIKRELLEHLRKFDAEGVDSVVFNLWLAKGEEVCIICYGPPKTER